jgi:hypothetical protein
MKTICCCLVALLMLNTYSLATPAEIRSDTQPAATSNAQPAEKIKAEVDRRGTGEKSRVKVRLRDKTEVKGYISQIDASTFQVTEEKTGRVMTLAYADVEKVGGRGMSRNTKTVIFIGVGIAAAGIILGILAGILNHS